MSSNSQSVMFIAEISANHLGSLERAHQLIDVATEAGADAVKMQTYTPDTMTLNIPEYSVSGTHSLWGGRTLYSLYQEAMTPWEWHKELFQHCRSNGVIPFSSPFDPTAVKFLESLDAPMYKIASLETSDHQLIRMVGETGKPTLISTGATELEEIEDLVKVFLSTGNQNLTLLVCTSDYPAQPKDANLSRIVYLQERFGLSVGVSDHTLSLSVPIVAITLGATAVEKHLTLNRDDGGADASFSLEPEEFKELVQEGKNAIQSLGDGNWEIQAAEAESRRLRRSLHIVRNVSKGETITNENVRAIRPGTGVSPKFLDELLGKRFLENYSRGTPMQRDFAQKE